MLEVSRRPPPLLLKVSAIRIPATMSRSKPKTLSSNLNQELFRGPDSVQTEPGSRSKSGERFIFNGFNFSDIRRVKIKTAAVIKPQDFAAFGNIGVGDFGPIF